MDKELFLKDLKENVYCRLQCSDVHGVGVFAIRDIPSGIDPFVGSGTDVWTEIPLTSFENDPDIAWEVKELTKAMYVIKDGMIFVPERSLNDINISFFVNHSKKPNTEARVIKKDFYFFTIRDIKKGQELLVDYDTYTDE